MCEKHKYRPGATLNDRAAHEKDHNLWSRRDFLSATGLFGMGSLLLGGLPVAGVIVRSAARRSDPPSARRLARIRARSAAVSRSDGGCGLGGVTFPPGTANAAEL